MSKIILKDYQSEKLSSSLFILMTIMTVIIGGFFIYCSFTNVLINDERGHTYATFLVYHGQLPYRDFFEHHHPLLWYVSYPIMFFFNNSAWIWYALRSLVLIFMGITLVAIFKICQLIVKDKIFAWLAVLFTFAPECVVLTAIEYRPDNLMLPLFFWGLYWFLKYILFSRVSYLSFAFILFFLSFMALQKVMFLLIPIGVVFLFEVIKKQKPFIDIIKASLIPLGLFVLFLAGLYFNGGLEDYFHLCIIYNLKFKLGTMYTITNTAYFWIALSLCIWCFFIENHILKLISFLTLASVFMLCFVSWSMYRQYWLGIYPYFAIITAFSTIFFIRRYGYAVVVLGCILLLVINNFIKARERNSGFASLQHYTYLSSKVLELSNKDDLIIGNLYTLGGLRFEATGYFWSWFAREEAPVIYPEYFKDKTLPDADSVMKTRKPKIISAENWRQCHLDGKYHSSYSCISYFPYDREFLDKNYDNYGFIYVRKQ